MFSTNFPQNTHKWDNFYREYNAMIQGYNPQWKVSRSIRVHQGRATFLKQQLPIFFPKTLCPRKEHPTSEDPVRSHTPQKSKYISFGPRPVSGRQEFTSDTSSPQSMLIYPKTMRRNFVSGNSITITSRAVKKGGTSSAQIETSP